MLLLVKPLVLYWCLWCQLLNISLRLCDSFSDHQKALVKLQNLHILINGTNDEVAVNPVFRSSIKLYQLVSVCMCVARMHTQTRTHAHFIHYSPMNTSYVLL